MDLHGFTGLYRAVKGYLHFDTRCRPLPCFDAEGSQAHGLIQNGRSHAPMEGPEGIAHPILRTALKDNAVCVDRQHLKGKHIANGTGRNLVKGRDPRFDLFPCHSSRTPASSQMETVS